MTDCSEKNKLAIQLEWVRTIRVMFDLPVSGENVAQKRAERQEEYPETEREEGPRASVVDESVPDHGTAMHCGPA